jgi:hypothetical protein
VLGTGLTCWALYNAGRAIRKGDSKRANVMFRRRIYAQAFTIAAMVAGSYYWESDRTKRKEYDKLQAEKVRIEKRNAWIRELEARDEENKAADKARAERRLIKQRAAKEAQEKAAAQEEARQIVHNNVDQPD